VKSSAGTRNVVGVKVKLDRKKLVVGARVALDQTTQTIMQVLPR
jgi:ATP-dependent 26S proteasome regulatory subunit